MTRQKKSRTLKWLKRHRRDSYVRQARREGYRSRAAYKLAQINQRDHLFSTGDVVLDLGASPGSWSQFAIEKVSPGGRVVAVDVLPMKAVKGVDFVLGDITEPETYCAVDGCLGAIGADLVISDLAPSITGIRHADQVHCIQLAEQARKIALGVLKAHGSFLVKIFEGESAQEFREQTEVLFDRATVRKPAASRSSSSEIYILASRPIRPG
jgi:23S rRNA (uridine2552-2'-O)-methyltransferase